MSDRRSIRSVSWALAVLAGTLPCARAVAQDLDTNLLVNPGFEDLLLGWTATNATTDNYSAGELPGLNVADVIDGGGRLAKDSNSGDVTQSINLPSIPLGANLRVGGYFGGIGDDKDTVVLRVRFFDAGPTPLAIVNLDAVDATARNHETVLMRREAVLAIPAGTIRVEISVDFTQGAFYTSQVAVADELLAELTMDSVVPAPLPLDTELLVNGDFESGYGEHSPLVLTKPQGWEGDGASDLWVRAYTDTTLKVEPGVSEAIHGGGNASVNGNLLSGHSSSNGGLADLRQRLDVRGNLAAGQFAQPNPPVLRVRGDFGGTLTAQDSARIRVRFRNLGGFVVIDDDDTGPVTPVERNLQSVLMRREREISVPATTAYIDVLVELDQASYGWPLADNISAKLALPSGPAAHAPGKNLLLNGNFEDGSFTVTPLVLDDPDSWVGGEGSYAGGEAIVRTVSYAEESELVPLLDFADAKGLGAQALRADSGDAILVQVIDLSAHAVQIDKNAMQFHAVAWLGGVDHWPDTARVHLQFLKQNQVPVGTAIPLGPVTAEDRGSLTMLLKRQATFDAPFEARALEVAVVFSETGFFASPHSLADGIEVSFTSKPVKTCDSVRLRAMGQAFKLAMGLESKLAKGGKYTELDLALGLELLTAKFEASFDGAAAKAHESGATCSSPGPATTFTAQILAAVDQAAAAIVEGVDPANPADTKLRATLIKLVGNLVNAEFKAEAVNVIVPSPAKLALSKQKARDAFLKAAAKAASSAASKAGAYDGLPADALADQAEGAVADILLQMQ